MYGKRIGIVLVLALALALPFAFGEGAKEVTSTEVNILMTPQEEWCQGMKQEFEAKYNITVNYVRMSSGEGPGAHPGRKGQPPVRPVVGRSHRQLRGRQAGGLLEAYDSPNYKNLLDPAKYKDADNYWVGIYVGTLGFCTNKDWLAANPKAKAPASWDDLLKPEFKGQILVAHPSTSGTSYTALATVLQIRGEEKGWQYLKAYASQVHQFTKSGAAPAKFVGQGEAAVGVVFSHDIVNEIDNNKLPLVLTFPKEGTGYEIGGMAILKGGKHRDAAQLWFDWAITAEAQALGPKYKAYQAPTVKGVKLSHPELLQVNLIKYDFQWAGKNKKAFIDKFTNELAGTANLK